MSKLSVVLLGLLCALAAGAHLQPEAVWSQLDQLADEAAAHLREAQQVGERVWGVKLDLHTALQDKSTDLRSYARTELLSSLSPAGTVVLLHPSAASSATAAAAAADDDEPDAAESRAVLEDAAFAAPGTPTPDTATPHDHVELHTVVSGAHADASKVGGGGGDGGREDQDKDAGANVAATNSNSSDVWRHGTACICTIGFALPEQLAVSRQDAGAASFLSLSSDQQQHEREHRATGRSAPTDKQQRREWLPWSDAPFTVVENICAAGKREVAGAQSCECGGVVVPCIPDRVTKRTLTSFQRPELSLLYFGPHHHHGGSACHGLQLGQATAECSKGVCELSRVSQRVVSTTRFLRAQVSINGSPSPISQVCQTVRVQESCTAPPAVNTSAASSSPSSHSSASALRAITSRFLRRMTVSNVTDDPLSVSSALCTPKDGVSLFPTAAGATSMAATVAPAASGCSRAAWSEWSACSASCGEGVQHRSRGSNEQGAACPRETQVRGCLMAPCKQDCTVSEWTKWSNCSADCGQGVATRTRTVLQPAQGEGKPCPHLREDRFCAGKGRACPEEKACQLGDWSDWEPCSARCGGGEHARYRNISSLMPSQTLYLECSERYQLSQVRGCHTKPCMQNCVVGEWEAETPCSVSCGGGVKQRSRKLILPAAFNGKACPLLTETIECNTQPCEEDCVVSDWTAWSSCSGACGEGIRVRTRRILRSPAHGGKECPPLEEVAVCKHAQACPPQCVFSAWEKWGECSAVCGSGLKERRRRLQLTVDILAVLRGEPLSSAAAAATSPSPSPASPPPHSSAPTPTSSPALTPSPSPSPSASASTTTPAPVTTAVPTTTPGLNILVHSKGAFARAQAAADSAPAAGRRVVAPQGTLPGDDDEEDANDDDDSDLQDDEDDRATVAAMGHAAADDSGNNGGHSDHANSNAATATATDDDDDEDGLLSLLEVASATGTQPVRTTADMFARAEVQRLIQQCGGLTSLRQAIACYVQPCPAYSEHIVFGAWSECSQPCGGGFMTRPRIIKRKCPKHARDCRTTETVTETKQCNLQPCSTNCAVSPFGDWSECSATVCGAGIQYRNRSVVVDNQNWGRLCGNMTQVVPCRAKVAKCPDFCGVWSSWSECSQSCGGGVQARTRVAARGSAVAPVHFDESVCGERTQNRPCATSACPVDCKVSEWSDWTSCSATCGGGWRTRTRTVLQAAQHGGAACPSLLEARECNAEPCPRDCRVTRFSDWSACSSSCGDGLQRRRRRAVESPQQGGKPCPALEEWRTCHAAARCDPTCPAPGPWSDWSACSKACGTGMRERTRVAGNSTKHPTAQCPDSVQGSSCHLFPCPIDCQVSDWGPWSVCDAACNGFTERRRTVLVKAQYGGKPCPTVLQRRDCSSLTCNADALAGCRYSSPSAWSTCTQAANASVVVPSLDKRTPWANAQLTTALVLAPDPTGSTATGPTARNVSSSVWSAARASGVVGPAERVSVTGWQHQRAEPRPGSLNRFLEQCPPKVQWQPCNL